MLTLSSTHEITIINGTRYVLYVAEIRNPDGAFDWHVTNVETGGGAHGTAATREQGWTKAQECAEAMGA